MFDFNINYLLALQNFREAAPPALTYFFLFVSENFSGAFLILIPLLLYWTYNKRFGAYLFCSFISASVVNEICKTIFCVYRPWILSEKLHLEPLAKTTATGYSMPSGHTATSTATYGALGYTFRRWVWPLVIAIVLSLLIAFSRNYLGAHTLTDVALALIIGWGAVIVCDRVYAFLDAHPERDIMICAGIAVMLIAVSVFVLLKPYPYDIRNGVLLADPAIMIEDYFKAAGGLAGFMAGRLLERRKIGFSINVGVKVKICRVLSGIAVAGLCYLLMHLLKSIIPGIAYYFILMTFLAFLTFGGVPALFVWAEKRFAFLQT